MKDSVSKRALQGRLNNLRRFILEFDNVEVKTESIQNHLFKYKNRDAYRTRPFTLRGHFREVLNRENLVKSPRLQYCQS